MLTDVPSHLPAAGSYSAKFLSAEGDAHVDHPVGGSGYGSTSLPGSNRVVFFGSAGTNTNQLLVARSVPKPGSDVHLVEWSAAVYSDQMPGAVLPPPRASPLMVGLSPTKFLILGGTITASTPTTGLNVDPASPHLLRDAYVGVIQETAPADGRVGFSVSYHGLADFSDIQADTINGVVDRVASGTYTVHDFSFKVGMSAVSAFAMLTSRSNLVIVKPTADKHVYITSILCAETHPGPTADVSAFSGFTVFAAENVFEPSRIAGAATLAWPVSSAQLLRAAPLTPGVACGMTGPRSIVGEHTQAVDPDIWLLTLVTPLGWYATVSHASGPGFSFTAVNCGVGPNTPALRSRFTVSSTAAGRLVPSSNIVPRAKIETNTSILFIFGGTVYPTPLGSQPDPAVTLITGQPFDRALYVAHFLTPDFTEPIDRDHLHKNLKWDEPYQPVGDNVPGYASIGFAEFVDEIVLTRSTSTTTHLFYGGEGSPPSSASGVVVKVTTPYVSPSTFHGNALTTSPSSINLALWLPVSVIIVFIVVFFFIAIVLVLVFWQKHRSRRRGAPMGAPGGIPMGAPGGIPMGSRATAAARPCINSHACELASW